MTINMHQIKQYLKHFFQAKRNGHGVHSPFAYELCEEVFYNRNTFYDFEALAAIRNTLLTDETGISITDLGAGSKTFKGSTRKIKDIAGKGISTAGQSEMIYRLMNFLKCSNAVELGTSLGMNALYMARVNKNNTVISIEGSKPLCDFAEELAKKNQVTNIQLIHSTFEEAFPRVLKDMEQLDLLYIDGNHTYTATCDYFQQALTRKHKGSVFIFDDIYWSKEMTKAWEEIKKHPSVSLSIDTFYSGLVFFKEEIREKVDLKFYL